MKSPLAWAALAALSAVPGFSQLSGIPEARVEEIAAWLPARPAGFGQPCPDRAAWAPLASTLQESVARGEALLRTPVPAWDDDDYLDFSRTGTRPRGERMMRLRQEPLSPLVLAECAEGRGRFLPRIALVLDQLAQQKSWVLPAHDAKLESYAGTRYIVDLNAAGLGHAIAQTLYLLGDRLPAETRRRTMDALHQRILAPARAAYAAGRGQTWLRVTSNWNPVCFAGVTGAALAVLPDRVERARFVAAAEHYSACFLQSFLDDGYALEGIGYWTYGFSRFAMLREELWRATGGKVDLFRNGKARRAALFGLEFQMLPGNYASFGDARFLTARPDSFLAYLEQAFGLPPSTRAPPSVGGLVESEVLARFPNGSRLEPAEAAAPTAAALRTYYPEAGVLVARPAPGGELAVTVKAGGNGPHSHNDIGSFAIGLGATQPVGDPGGPHFYTAATFTAKRFESRLLNSWGHPVPVLGATLQLDATKLRPQVLRQEFTPEQDTLTIDLTKAYDHPGLRRLERTFVYSRKGRGSLRIEDRFELSAPTAIEEGLPTHGTCRQLDGKTLEFSLGGQRLKVEFQAASELEVRQESIDEYGNPFTRVGVRFPPAASGSIVMIFTPQP